MLDPITFDPALVAKVAQSELELFTTVLLATVRPKLERRVQDARRLGYISTPQARRYMQRIRRASSSR